MVIEEEVKRLAYEIWEREGRPHGKDVEHYYGAKRILEERESVVNIRQTTIMPQSSADSGIRKTRRRKQ